MAKITRIMVAPLAVNCYIIATEQHNAVAIDAGGSVPKILQFLQDNGLIHLKTDSKFLFTYTNYMVERNHLPVLFCTEDLYHTDGFDEQTLTILSIQTYYEAQWIERGLNIRYLKFRLPHDGGLEEPDIEIPLDDYRSYKRPKRSGLETSK